MINIKLHQTVAYSNYNLGRRMRVGSRAIIRPVNIMKMKMKMQASFEDSETKRKSFGWGSVRALKHGGLISIP
jgi:hypothetical protein